MRSSTGLRFGVLVFVSCCSVKIEAIQSSPSRLHSFNKRIECIGRRYNALRAQVSCSSEQVAATRAFEPPIDSIIRLRGGMALNDYFTSAKSAKSSKEQDAELKPEESKTAIDNVPIKWVVAGTVGGLCLLSNQIAHALVLGYGVTFPAYCRCAVKIAPFDVTSSLQESLSSLKILEEFAKDSKQIANPAAANELLTYWVCNKHCFAQNCTFLCEMACSKPA
jgi:hypothetical protein